VTRSGRNLDDDPFVAPLRAASVAGLPRAIVVLGGCDPLRDEGRLYARRPSTTKALKSKRSAVRGSRRGS
jgi:acetyl esterase/lipase